MPKKHGYRDGYVYVTASIRQEDFTLLEAYARTMGEPITRVIGELVHEARPVLAMNAAMHPEVNPHQAIQTVLNTLDAAMQEVRRQARDYERGKEAS